MPHSVKIIKSAVAALSSDTTLSPKHTPIARAEKCRDAASLRQVLCFIFGQERKITLKCCVKRTTTYTHIYTCEE